MGSSASDELIGTWLTGWASGRGYESRHEGRIHAALRHDTIGDWEYVIHEPSDEELVAISDTLHKHPSRLLTAFVDSPDRFAEASHAARLGVRKNDEVLMVTDMGGQDVEEPISPDGFTLQTERDSTRAYVSVHVEDAPELVAASGHVTVVEDYAVFDRIVTTEDYRRRGLGSLVMRALAALALEHDVSEGLLIATVDGQGLYGYLGWTTLGSMVTVEAAQH
ncbi:GNAT family N-acetyltransferase [Zhihengliuella flava]|uniref:GNAT superfamily N-acetyltransferase n=1 Tax=Zhihengliuella flava TaxID=1285193 RepID=A0A931D859_9MICC|nr:GNAT family N-acetyltransferase [Zhihengliuella flava]MBG6084159.1 GNAT superfamily N-acetyltransferase [Zhihengliuella flava]